MRTRNLLIAIALLCLLISLPFQCLTPRGHDYRKLANRNDRVAADFRAAARKALAKGNRAEAEQHRMTAERLEQRAWAYRRESYREWKWPELKLPGGNRLSD